MLKGEFTDWGVTCPSEIKVKVAVIIRIASVLLSNHIEVSAGTSGRTGYNQGSCMQVGHVIVLMYCQCEVINWRTEATMCRVCKIFTYLRRVVLVINVIPLSDVATRNGETEDKRSRIIRTST